MTRLSSRSRIPENMRGGIVALGNFDGFHLGHHAVAGEAISWAKAEGRPAIVATFDPHPVRHFRPDAAPFRLTTLDQREELFAEAGADAMLVIAFDGQTAGMSASGWVEEFLHDHLGAKGVVTGEDFTFGKGREGNVARLAELGGKLGIEARHVGPVRDADGVISSSRVRDALREGDCEEAARLLTRPFTIRGQVIHGDKRGREIGYPTANIELGQYLRPRFGIYAVTGRLPDGRLLKGAANLGVRPTFDPPRELLEPYFFDFDGDLYGQEIDVAFHRFLRAEERFETLDALTAQMAKDCEAAREALSGADFD